MLLGFIALRSDSDQSFGHVNRAASSGSQAEWPACARLVASGSGRQQGIPRGGKVEALKKEVFSL